MSPRAGNTTGRPDKRQNEAGVQRNDGDSAEPADPRTESFALIVDSLQELLAMDGAGESDAVDEETRLLGRSAVVESMGLVT